MVSSLFSHLSLLINLHVCILQTHEYESMNMYAEAKSRLSDVFLYHSLPYFFEIGSFTEAEAPNVSPQLPSPGMCSHAWLFMWMPRALNQVLMLAKHELLQCQFNRPSLIIFKSRLLKYSGFLMISISLGSVIQELQIFRGSTLLCVFMFMI